MPTRTRTWQGSFISEVQWGGGGLGMGEGSTCVGWHYSQVETMARPILHPKTELFFFFLFMCNLLGFKYQQRTSRFLNIGEAASL